MGGRNRKLEAAWISDDYGAPLPQEGTLVKIYLKPPTLELKCLHLDFKEKKHGCLHLLYAIISVFQMINQYLVMQMDFLLYLRSCSTLPILKKITR